MKNNKDKPASAENSEDCFELITKYGDVPVAIQTEEGMFPLTGCYYDIFAESIIMAE